MIQNLDYFYDAQQYRFLQQLVRAFSGFQYMTGSIAGNPATLQVVPCRMATTNRTVASIMRNQSENTLLTTPMITVWQTSLSGSPDRLQNRNYVDSRQVVEREISNGVYTENDGLRYTVERIMPLPFEMKIQVDIWTSNLHQKYQLEEQILTTMFPSFDIQNSENALDWTALTTVYIEDIVHSSRSIPIGTNDEIDIMTINLRLPIWLSPPAKIKQQKLINQIITNITDEARLPGVTYDDDQHGNRFTQFIVTPEQQHISVNNGVITFLQQEGQSDPTGNAYVWSTFLEQYGLFRPSASEITLLTSNDINGPGVTGTIQFDPNNNLNLLWQIDPTTLPANTLAAVNAVINPVVNYPNDGHLPSPANGQRYLLVHDVGNSISWGNLSAKSGDIIEYNNFTWTVAFRASGTTSLQYVINLMSGRQLRWIGDNWVLALDGIYAPGFFKIKL